MEIRSKKHPSPKAMLLRKSPRLVLSSSISITKSKKRSTSPSKRVDNSRALSVHVVNLNLDEVQEAIPLDFYDPNAGELEYIEGTPPRRSSRFTKNKYKSVSPGRGLQIALISPRRSSRFTKNRYITASPERFRGGPLAALPFSASRTSSRVSERLNLTEGSKKRRHSEEEQSELSGSGGGSSQEKVSIPMRSHEGIFLRKSPRLKLNLNLDKAKDGNSKNEFLALPGHSLCNSSENHLRRRSPRLNSNMVGVKNGNHEKAMVALPDMISVQKSALRICSLSGKSSLCRTAKMELDEGRKKMARNDSGTRTPSNVGEKLIRSRKIESELSKTSNGSTSPQLGCGNAAEKCLRSRKVEIQSPGSGVQEHGGNAGDKSLRSRKSTVPRGTSLQSDDDNAGRNCLESRNLEIEWLGDSYSGSQHMNVSEKHLKSEKIELQGMEKVAPECNNIEQRDLNSVENCLLSDEKELDIRDQPVGKCEPDVSGVNCLRTQNVVAGEHAAKASTIVYGKNSRSGASSIKSKKSGREDRENTTVSFFIGEPFTEEEAMKRWEWRYKLKSSKSKRNGAILNAGEEDETILNVEFHYAQASIEGSILSIGDCALIQGEGKENHIGRILEFFKTMDGEDYFRVQWFYRAEDTVMKESATCHDNKRIFYSTLKNDNPLDCIVSKVNVTKVPSAVSLKQDTIPPTDFYYDMEYCVEYSTFRNLQLGDTLESQDPVPHKPGDVFHKPITATPLAGLSSCELKTDLALLDLYSGCGGMSTGLSLGAKLCSINLVTRWAVDFEKAATESLKLNHPETQVRNETAQDFLELLKSWEKLWQSYVFSGLEKIPEVNLDGEIDGELPEDFDSDKDEDTDEEFEVSRLLDVCHGDPNETGKSCLHFKVRWKGYGPDEDTWEPIEGLSNCKERIEDFVREGLRLKILPLPGDVDVICGGPPCQGISGYNRYRNTDAPLTDEKNHQIVVFMDIVEFLKPKYVLMENVTDILKFGGAFLGRYALSRLVYMKYQARLGTIAAGCYGLPQFRLRVFLWGAISSEKLPPFPLPTHEVVVKYWPPLEFEKNTVAYDEGQRRKLQDAAILSDAISDLPAITSQQKQEEMPYGMPPVTEFQKYIRLTKEEMMGFTYPQSTGTKELLLYDHRSIAFSEDNCLRVSQVPRRKGANFRDLPGVIVGDDNVARRDPKMEPARLPSGELLLPDCVFTFEKGRSRRPLARLWWDETVATVLTFPNFLSQTILHPDQDRVLSIRECARLQGFPDYYRFSGTVKERYCQIGNAVAIPVGRALGYALGMAYQKLTDDEPLMTLPPNFAFQVPTNDEIVVLGN